MALIRYDNFPNNFTATLTSAKLHIVLLSLAQSGDLIIPTAISPPRLCRTVSSMLPAVLSDGGRNFPRIYGCHWQQRFGAREAPAPLWKPETRLKTKIPKRPILSCAVCEISDWYLSIKSKPGVCLQVSQEQRKRKRASRKGARGHPVFVVYSLLTGRFLY